MTPHDIPATVVVVGDRFDGIAQHGGVQTLSQLIKIAQSRPKELPATIIVGQGIGDFDLIALSSALEECGHEPRPQILASGLDLASRSTSHKRRPQNVLIANLAQVGKLAATADLIIDNDNELLLDHQTGQHVQGMVVVEASRQMFLASTTCLRLTEGLTEPYFVIGTMSTQFNSFLFPLPASLIFNTSEPDRSRPDSAGFEAVIEIEQNGVRVSATRVEYTVFVGSRIHEIETRKAEKALRGLLPSHAEGATTVV